MICSSVNRFRFIYPSFVRADSKSFWRKFLGVGQTYSRQAKARDGPVYADVECESPALSAA
ncbi:hypothetical protein BRAS3809_1280002 [Bradyrhizobium sp. STM 3809]|nr:hypothetical protein BRAS3809_1280002 [Bradyrhizobium sp. STM 3809]